VYETDVKFSYVWWARKAEDASTSTYSHEPVLDDELIQTDEEDDEQHAVDADGVTNVPLPSATDVTQASVDQLSALAVSDEAPISEAKASADATTKKKEPTPSADKDKFAAPPS
jgi:hypothetical protein